MKSGIYKIESINNPERFYIGSTINFVSRRQQHFNKLNLNKHHSSKIQRHVKEYGHDDLLFTIIEYCEEEDLIKREQFYIDTLKPYFNTSRSARRNTVTKMSDENKLKVGAFFKGRYVTLDTRRKISQALKGKKQQPQSEKTRLLKSKINKGKIFTQEHRDAIRIGKRIKMTQEVRLRLSQCKRGFKHSEITKQKIRDKRKNQIITYYKPVTCISTNIKYKSVKAAAKEMGVTSTTINNWCNKITKSKYVWQWG